MNQTLVGGSSAGGDAAQYARSGGSSEKQVLQPPACTIEAPSDGRRRPQIYSVIRDQQIQEGVRWSGSCRSGRRTLLAMQAVVRSGGGGVAAEGGVSGAEVRIIGQAKPVQGTLTKIRVLSDSVVAVVEPGPEGVPVDLTLDQTPPGLKPGVGTMCDIYVDRLKDVIAVPLTSIYSAGGDTYVFVRRGADAVPTKVTLGKTNETHAEVAKGLDAGQEVLLLQAGQGRELRKRPASRSNSNPPPAPAAAKASAAAAAPGPVATVNPLPQQHRAGKASA